MLLHAFIEHDVSKKRGEESPLDSIKPCSFISEIRFYKLAKLSLVVPNRVAEHLYWDLQTLLGVAKEMPESSQAAADALYTANAIINAIHRDDPTSLERASRVAKTYFEQRKGSTAHHIISAIGNW